jgi:hypothetical protein
MDLIAQRPPMPLIPAIVLATALLASVLVFFALTAKRR